MIKEILYTTLLLINGFVWIAITLYFKNIIKKNWLYTLFPLIISSTCCTIVITYYNKLFLSIPLALTVSYYIYSVIRGMKMTDILLIPFVLNIIIASALIK
ncbi:MAG: hypothetical protein QXT47_04390 [Desulfurococcaceae archaeon]